MSTRSADGSVWRRGTRGAGGEVQHDRFAVRSYVAGVAEQGVVKFYLQRKRDCEAPPGESVFQVDLYRPRLFRRGGDFRERGQDFEPDQPTRQLKRRFGERFAVGGRNQCRECVFREAALKRDGPVDRNGLRTDDEFATTDG